MRSIVWLILLFAVAVVAALTLGDNDGLASFYWAGWRLDLSLNFFLLLAFAGGGVALSTVHAARTLIGLPERAREWRAQRYEQAGQAALRQALTEYFSARYTRSHKAALRALAIRADADSSGAAEHEFRTLARLLAAGSLHRLQDRRQRDDLLQQVFEPGRRAEAPVDEGALLQIGRAHV